MVVHALDTTWELHKPYLQKSSLLSSLLRRAEMTGMRNIEEEEEEDAPKAGDTGIQQTLQGAFGTSHVKMYDNSFNH